MLKFSKRYCLIYFVFLIPQPKQSAIVFVTILQYSCEELFYYDFNDKFTFTHFIF